jgi:hypothetical protein
LDIVADIAITLLLQVSPSLKDSDSWGRACLDNVIPVMFEIFKSRSMHSPPERPVGTGQSLLRVDGACRSEMFLHTYWITVAEKRNQMSSLPVH